MLAYIHDFSPKILRLAICDAVNCDSVTKQDLRSDSQLGMTCTQASEVVANDGFAALGQGNDLHFDGYSPSEDASDADLNQDGQITQADVDEVIALLGQAAP